MNEQNKCKQEMEKVFVQVAKHLLAQDQKSHKYGMGCLYRGPGGTSCAVGCLIDEEHYNHVMEGCSAKDSEVLDALENSGIPVFDGMVEMLAELQALHDHEDTQVWRQRLEDVAVNGLFWTPKEFKTRVLS